MFANTFQSGFISIFYSVGSSPLALWDKQVKNGHIRRVIDDEVKSLVLEVSGTNVATTYITCPIKPRASLGVRLPFLVMIIKNMKKYFTFEVQILDDKDMHRRFRISNFQSATKVRPFCTTMPIGLSNGWNQVQFNLADFTKRAYGSTYLETVRVQIHANVRIRRIYFSDILYSDEDMPNEFKLFMPGPKTQVRAQQEKKISQSEGARKNSKEGKRLSKSEEIPSGAPPSPVEPAGESREPEPKLSIATEVPALDLGPDVETQSAAPEEGDMAEPGAVEEAVAVPEGEPSGMGEETASAMEDETTKRISTAVQEEEEPGQPTPSEATEEPQSPGPTESEAATEEAPSVTTEEVTETPTTAVTETTEEPTTDDEE